MTHPIYFWKDNQVISVPRTMASWKLIDMGLDNCYCINPNWNSSERYGTYHQDLNQFGNTIWSHRAKEHFPREFLVHLLLMGVPT